MIWETVRLALISVRRNALRSFLTLLGIVIGVAAVIAMITIGSGTTEKVKADIAKLGSNLLVVRSGADTGPGGPRVSARPLSQKDYDILATKLEGVEAVSAASQTSVRVVFGTESLQSAVTGTDDSYFAARNWSITAGRAFSESELRAGSSVCIIGSTVSRQFFGTGDPLDATIRVRQMSCRVIGLLESKGFSGFGQDQDNVVMMPLAAFQRRIAGDRDIETIYVAGRDGVATSAIQASMEELLRESRRVAPDADSDFTVRDMTQVADAMASATTAMTGMLGAVAGVSLLVGGIGIMNIMLVSVTERTREIGIRLAIGAHERHILLQFLVEATVLSAIGGLTGVALGLAIAGGVAYVLTIPFSPSIAIVLMAFGFSAVIGMVFGFFPALRGARLDPIEALRHE
jgi:putative ABC transport system permease protein